VNLYSEQYVAMPDELRSQILASIRQQLADRVAKRGHTETTPVIVTGSVAQSIIDAVGDQGADLIVMGTHGRHGVAHLLLGSVAERVVRTATCPVLTVRTPMEAAKHAAADMAGRLAPVHA
jgi:nucleotide-binding universal stress UspA family protein